LIIEYNGTRPRIADDAFIAPNATIIGNVIIEAGANIWFGAVLRGDTNRIVIGPRTSVQDNAVIHANAGNPTIVEADVAIGHLVVLEGCHIEEGALIGMNATVLDGATVGRRALVAAGSVVGEHQVIPPEVLAAGVPAKVKGPMSKAVYQRVLSASSDYQKIANNYKKLRDLEINLHSKF
jgi:carbonic anhydrase/acetyltransferase-like protein (isoleucine patch superfamily)